MALGERLRHARSKACLSFSQVKERTLIGESSLSEYENGKREPSISQLSKLAALYRRSLSFFLEEGPLPAEPSVLWRERPTENSEDIGNQFLLFCQRYRNLELWCNDVRPSYLPAVAENSATFGFQHANRLAKETRDKLQLGDRPGQSLLRILAEVCAVKIFHFRFQPTGTAASTKSDSFGYAVLLNSGNTRWRRNFDLAHELFHLLTWDLFGHSSDENSTIATEREEQLADSFARNLLIPSEVLHIALEKYQDVRGNLSIEDIISVARQFDVSLDALMWQIHNVYRRQSDVDITKNQIKQIKAYTARYKDGEQDSPPKWPARYRMLAIKAYRKGEISTGKLAEFLEISRQEAMRYGEQEGDSEEIQITLA